MGLEDYIGKGLLCLGAAAMVSSYAWFGYNLYEYNTSKSLGYARKCKKNIEICILAGIPSGNALALLGYVISEETKKGNQI